MSDYLASKAQDDFNRVRTKELLERIQNFLNPDRQHLLSLTDVKTLIKPDSETYQGIKVVPLDLIVGSEGRYRDFNNHFLPKHSHLRSRWESVDRANLHDVILPPITLYEIGGVYFVRDGNHRVSVAKSQGVQAIDAEVIGLSSKILIKPGMTIEDLKREVILYEKKRFYKTTNFGDLTDCWNMDFTSPGRYDEIYNQILVHKYYINQSRPGEIPFAEALVSFYRNVYRPVMDVIAASKIVSRFPGRTQADLYVFIVKHWDMLKQKYGRNNVGIKDAVMDFSAEYGQPLGTRIRVTLKALFGRTGR